MSEGNSSITPAAPSSEGARVSPEESSLFYQDTQAPEPVAKVRPASRNSFEDLLEDYGIDPLTGADIASKVPTEVREKVNGKTGPSLGKEESLLNEAASEVRDVEERANQALKDQKQEEGKGKDLLKFTDGQQDIEISQDAKIDIQVGDKNLPVPLKQLVATFSKQEEFNRNADARVHYITHKEKQHAADVVKTRDYFTKISEAASSGDPTQAIKVMAEMAGKDPVVFEREYLDNLEQTFEVWTQMDPQQKNNYMLERQAEFYKQKYTKMEEAQKSAVDRQQLATEVDGLKQIFGLSDDQLRGYYQEMVEEGYDPKEITPNHLKGYLLTNIHYIKVCEGIKQVDERLLDNEKLIDGISELTAKDFTLTPDDIAEIVREAIRMPSEKVQNLNQKIQSSPGLRNQVGHVSSNKTESDYSDLDDYFLNGRRG